MPAPPAIYTNTPQQSNYMVIPQQTTSSWIINQTANSTLSNIQQPVQWVSNNVNGIFISDSTGISSAYSEPDYFLSLLRGAGLEIGQDRVLAIRDDVPVIIKTHKDGSTTTDFVTQQHRGVIDFSAGNEEFGVGAVMKLPDGAYLEIDKDGKLVQQSYAHARQDVIDVSGGSRTLYESLAYCHFREIHIPNGLGDCATFILPNGVKIKLFPDDHIEIDETDGRQLYKTMPIREFNRHLNASDLLEDFIAFCAQQKVSRKDFSELPISLFIYWLIVQAAEADGDPTQEVQPLLTTAVKQHKHHGHRCRCCGKFLSIRKAQNGINFCSPDHMQRYMTKFDM